MIGWIELGNWEKVEEIVDYAHNLGNNTCGMPICDVALIGLKEKNGVYYGNKIPYLLQAKFSLGKFAK